MMSRCAGRRVGARWLPALALLLAAACSEPSVELYLAVRDPRAASGADAPGALLSAQPRFRECLHCDDVELKLPGGLRAVVRAEPEPRLRLAPGDIEGIRLREVRHPLQSERSRWQAWATLAPHARERLAPLAADFPADTVLVCVRGEPTDLYDGASALADGVRLAVLHEKEELDAFVSGLELGVPVSWEPFDEEAYAQQRRQLLEQLQRYEGTGDGSQEPDAEGEPSAP